MNLYIRARVVLPNTVARQLGILNEIVSYGFDRTFVILYAFLERHLALFSTHRRLENVSIVAVTWLLSSVELVCADHVLVSPSLGCPLCLTLICPSKYDRLQVFR